jgi:hypothetical protein
MGRREPRTIRWPRWLFICRGDENIRRTRVAVNIENQTELKQLLMLSAALRQIRVFARLAPFS